MASVRSAWCGGGLALRRALRVLAASAGLLVLAGCGGVVETSWSPDGKAVAYSAGDELRVYDVATKQSRSVYASDSDVISPTWSPDGKAIAFYSVTWGENAGVDLRAADPDSGQVRTLVPGVCPLQREVEAAKVEAGRTAEEALLEAQKDAVGGLMFAGTISWSPDSTRLACVAGSESAARVLLVNLASGKATPIIEGGDIATALAWSPDGRRLAYMELPSEPDEPSPQSQQAPESQPTPPTIESLWLYEFDTGAASKVCELPEGAFLWGTRPEWSADSREIGFILDDKHNQDRATGCVVEARPGAPVREVLRGITEAAAWAPGLRGVAFLEDRKPGPTVLIYRGLAPRTRRVLGELPRGTSGEKEVQRESSSDDGPPHSLRTFPRDGRRVALRVGEDEELQIAVFEVP